MTTDSAGAWTPPAPARPRRRGGRIVFWALFGLMGAAMIAAIVGFFVTGKPYTIPSGSMQNTLPIPGDAPSSARFSAAVPGDEVVPGGEVWLMGDHRLISFDSRGWHRALPKSQIVGRVIYSSRGSSPAAATTPETFVADGLAPADNRVPWPLALVGIAAVALLALIALSVAGVIGWRVHRGRERRRQAAAYTAYQQVI